MSRRAASRVVLALVALGACHAPRSAVPAPDSTTRVAQLDPALDARIVRCTPLRYDAPAPPELDRPAHVRAGSGLCRVEAGLLIAQDDASFLAVRDDAGAVRALTLPYAPGGRRQFSDAIGNKADKLDLEACLTLPDGRAAVLGSGSTDRRVQIVIVDPAAERVHLHDGAALFAALRRERAFAGAELNVEAAVVIGDRVRLFNRGNGAARDGLTAISASVDLSLDAFLAWLDGGAVPALEAVRGYDLGAASGVPYGFTDACALDDDRVLFLAGAEDAPDVTRDGPVLGARVGVIDARGVRFAELHEADGSPSRQKLEGLALDPAGLPRAWAITDADDPDAAALLCELSLHGPF